MLDKELALNKLKESTTVINDCWIWNKWKLSRGHGIIYILGKTYLVHRLSAYIHLNFDLENKKLVLHKNICSSPSCWNPDHLYVGDYLDNMRDLIQKKGPKLHIPKTHCPKGHEYTPENTYVGKRSRACRTCYRKTLNVGKRKEERIKQF